MTRPPFPPAARLDLVQGLVVHLNHLRYERHHLEAADPTWFVRQWGDVIVHLARDLRDAGFLDVAHRRCARVMKGRASGTLCAYRPADRHSDLATLIGAADQLRRERETRSADPTWFVRRWAEFIYWIAEALDEHGYLDTAHRRCSLVLGWTAVHARPEARTGKRLLDAPRAGARRIPPTRIDPDAQLSGPRRPLASPKAQRTPIPRTLPSRAVPRAGHRLAR